MTIEEKAKAYDQAIERAKVFKEHLLEIEEKGYADEMDYIFPVLKENKDEKMRRDIITYLKQSAKSTTLKVNEQKFNKWIAWLEKKGEQREQLINKACVLLVNCIEDFMLRRMEMWDEECKEQTLENIRKKLEE